MPDPLAPDVIEIHDALADAVHEHPAADDTWRLSDPPDASKDLLVGEMLIEHPDASETVNV